MMCIFCAGLFVAAAILAPVIIREGSHMHPGLLAAASRAIEFVGTDVDERGGLAVVRVLQDDNVLSSRRRARQPQSQFVGSAARGYKQPNPHRARDRPRRPLAVAL